MQRLLLHASVRHRRAYRQLHVRVRRVLARGGHEVLRVDDSHVQESPPMLSAPRVDHVQHRSTRITAFGRVHRRLRVSGLEQRMLAHEMRRSKCAKPPPRWGFTEPPLARTLGRATGGVGCSPRRSFLADQQSTFVSSRGMNCTAFLDLGFIVVDRMVVSRGLLFLHSPPFSDAFRSVVLRVFC